MGSHTNHYLSFLILLWFSCLQVSAQDPDPFSYASRIQPSAEAWQMARHGEISPDLFTGAMAWSLPLYTYKDEDFTIPISLDYRFDGCRPAQPAGTVGYGWTLNCGGVITREVVGLPDDYISLDSYYSATNEYNTWKLGYYFVAISHDYVVCPNLAEILGTNTYMNMNHCIGIPAPVCIDLGKNHLTSLMGTTPLFSNTQIQYNSNTTSPLENPEENNVSIDGGPYFDPSSDLYHFSLPDVSGDFVILPSGEVKVFNCSDPEGEVEVHLAYSLLGNNLCTTTITVTRRGYTYKFGGDIEYVEYDLECSTGEYNNRTEPTRHCFSSLFLSSVTAPNGRQVIFSRNTEYPFYEARWNPAVRYRLGNMMGQPDQVPPTVSNIISRPLQSVIVDGDTLVRFNYLDKAHAEFGYDAFVHSMTQAQFDNILPYYQGFPAPTTQQTFNKANRLASVIVRNRESQLIDSIALGHAYTSASLHHSPKMFLQTVEGNAGRYSFEYDYAGSSDEWPAVDTVVTDHWGFWNGNGASFPDTTSHRQQHSLYDLPGTAREPDTTLTMRGALRLIRYPSGGWSRLYYEPNRASRRIDIDAFALNGTTQIDSVQSFLAGGARIRKIVNDAGPCGSFRDSVEYDYCGSGLLVKMPRYFMDIDADYDGKEWTYLQIADDGPGQWFSELVSGHYILSTYRKAGFQSPVSGSHVNYAKVSVKAADGSFTETQFSRYDDYPDIFLHDPEYQDEGMIISTEKIMGGNMDNTPDKRMFLSISETNEFLLLKNERLSNILLSDFSCLRGKPLVKRVYSAENELLQESRYSYRADSAATAAGVYSIYSDFLLANRTFIQPRLDSVITTEYLPGGGSLSDTTLYTYNNLGQQTVVEKRGFDGSIRRSRLRYEHESDTTAPRANISEIASTRIAPEGEGVQEYITSLRHFEYDTDSARRHLPVLAVDYGKPTPWAVSADTTIGWFSPLAPDDTVTRRLSYDAKHRPDSLLLPGGAYVAFVWDTSGRYPLTREDNGPSMVSTYQWKDMVGLTKKTEPALRSEWYAYDSKWRLSEVRRADSVKITAYDYHLWCEDSTAGPSYTKQTTWRTSNKNNRDIVYYDGLGYPIQRVRTSTQTQWGHIVTPIRYDALRRDDVQAYLPYEARYSSYNSADSTAQGQYYKLQFGNNEIYPYAERVYGTSPAGRLLSSRQPGKDYADSSKVVTYDYRTNSAEDSILDLSVTVSATPQLTVGAAYLPAGKLLLTKTTDEDGCTSEVFTDASGKTVLSRQRTGGQRLDTYRIYDLRDSLVCVLQPEGSASIQLGSSHTLLPPVARNDAGTLPTIDALLDHYAFLYAWDSRGRLAAKKRPGASAEEFLSDDRGRVVLNRDGNLRSQGKWLYSEYDGYDALLKKSLISVELGLDTLRRAARNQVDSSYVVVTDSIRLWEFVLNGEPQSSNRVYSKMTLPAAGDSLFTEDFTFIGLSSGTGFDTQGAYFLKGTQKYYPTFNSIFFDAEWEWQIVNDWPTIFADAITSNTLIEEHRYDRGDSPEIPQALDFIPVTGIVAAADTSSTHNLEVWQRQLMLPPGRTIPGDTTHYVERAFYYDVPGNLVQTVETNALGGISRTSAKYDYLGNVLVSEEKHTRANTTTADVKRTSYVYDNHGRMSSEYVALNNTAITETEFDYDILGRIIWTWGQGEDFEKAVQETYSYDIRGRLLAKEAFRMSPYVPGPGGGGGGDEEEEEEEEEDPEWDATSIFLTLFRCNAPLKQAGVARWNGLISEIEHQRGDNGAIITNDYYYDKAGRLVDHNRYDGVSQTNKYTERDLSFDRNGNILSLKRYGTNIAAPQDNLTYTYEGNKLMQLNNWEYSYDANGNMTSDGRRNLLLSWNHLNLPATISNEEDEDATVNYTYLADGTKALAQASGTSEGYAYLGTMVYKLNNGTWTLETTPFTGGRFVRNATGAFIEQRHITDHLGSTRTIVEGDDYTEVEQNDYYPFGKRIADNTLPTTATNRWRFSGKEIQTIGGINLIDYGARLYDEDAVKWKSQDPMADSYLGLTPYGYCAGNPVSIVDPTGKEWKDIKGNPIDNHEKIRVYIFYDPMSFEKQSKHMYDKAIKQYGKGSAALSDVTSEKAFVEDWASMSSNSISEVDLNYHGNNQTLIMNPSESEYITSTGDGLTNVLGNSATNVQDLPNPQGDISNEYQFL